MEDKVMFLSLRESVTPYETQTISTKRKFISAKKE